MEPNINLGDSMAICDIVRKAEFSTDVKKWPGYIEDFNLRPRTLVDAEMECEFTINTPLFNKLCGVNLAGSSDFTVIAKSPYSVQCRRHRKKRINKKWAKRYGYAIKFKDVRLENVNLIRDKGFEFELIGACNNYLV